MTLATVETAVYRRGSDRKETVLDWLFALWFSRFVYNQIWEDPEVDLAAMELDPSCRVVTIASGGCNVLNYLTADPGSVVAVDLNPAHIALTRRKIAVMRHAPYHDAFLRFFGAADDPLNVAYYDGLLRWKLDPETRAFWERRTLSGRRRIEFFGKGLYRRALLGRFIGFLHGLGRVLGKDPARLLQAQDLAAQEKFFTTEVAPLFDNRFVRTLCRQKVLTYSLGIPPHQFASLEEASGGDLAALYRERLRKLVCDFPIGENYFAWQAFGRRYDLTEAKSLPPYLQAANYDAIRDRLGRVETQTVSMTEFLGGEPAESCDRYVLLDSLDWMDAAMLAELWEEIRRTARPGARVIFRTAGARSPLEDLLPPESLKGWHAERERARQLFQRDRSAIYGGFHLYIRD
jgi:S-adenosylmethionine-diacylglycerol 3-amino-3-carboxypropyl transferase